MVTNYTFAVLSGEASPTFGHANAKLSVFIDSTLYKESISKEMSNDDDLNLHLVTKCRAGFATDCTSSS